MIPVRAIRCVHCPRPVHPTHGGAYCAEHTPLDLTGGVSPGDSTGRREVLRDDGRRRSGRPRGTTEQQVAEWVALYEGGMTSYAIERQCGISSGLVRHYLRRAGVTARPPGRPRVA